MKPLFYIFLGIVSDLFPLIEEQIINYGPLEKSIRDVILSFELDDVDSKQIHSYMYKNNIIVTIICIIGYVHKVIQLYETTIVRHGLMLVGPTGSGKTKVN